MSGPQKALVEAACRDFVRYLYEAEGTPMVVVEEPFARYYAKREDEVLQFATEFARDYIPVLSPDIASNGALAMAQRARNEGMPPPPIGSAPPARNAHVEAMEAMRSALPQPPTVFEPEGDEPPAGLDAAETEQVFAALEARDWLISRLFAVLNPPPPKHEPPDLVIEDLAMKVRALSAALDAYQAARRSAT